MKKVLSCLLIATLVVFFVISGYTKAAPAPAPKPITAADFYKGKMVIILVGTAAGGAVDLTTRITAAFLKKKLGANVVVKNTGTGNVVVANGLMKAKDPQGLELSCVSKDTLLGNQIADDPAVKYDATKLQCLLAVNPCGYVFMVRPDSPYKTMKDLQLAKKLLKFGGQQPSSNIDMAAVLVAEVLGLDVKLITGYKGTSPMMLAVRTGELDGAGGSEHTGVLTEGQGMAKNLLFVADKKSVLLPNLPILGDAKMSPDTKRFLRLYTQLGSSKIFYAPPDTPPDRVKFLRDILEEIAVDKDFKEAIDSKLEKYTGYIRGEELQKEVSELVASKAAFTGLYALAYKYKP